MCWKFLSFKRFCKNSGTNEKAVERNNLNDKVKLSGAFCLGKCTEGVSVKFDDEIVCGVSEDNFDETFQKYVLDKI